MLFFEQFEKRLTLSGAHAGETLEISGTAQGDDLVLGWDSGQHLIRVTNSGILIGEFSMDGFEGVQIDAGAGDDRIHVDPDLPFHVLVDGGDGNDTLAGLPGGHDELHVAGELHTIGNRSMIRVETVRADDEMGEPSPDPAAHPHPGDLLSIMGSAGHGHSFGAMAIEEPMSSPAHASDVHSSSSMPAGAAHAAMDESMAMDASSGHAGMRMSMMDGFGRAVRLHQTMNGEEVAAADGSAAMASHSETEQPVHAPAGSPVHRPAFTLAMENDMEAILAGWAGGHAASIFEPVVVKETMPAPEMPSPELPVVNVHSEAPVPPTVVHDSGNEVLTTAATEVVQAVFESAGSPTTGEQRNWWPAGGAAGVAILAASGAFLLESKANRSAREDESGDDVFGPLVSE